MSFTVWAAFLLASVVIAVSPGPGAVICMSTGLRHGNAATLRVIAGLEAALLVHLAVVFAGLGAVLAASTTAFTIVKIIGAAYLLWLGIEKWRDPGEAVDGAGAAVTRSLFLQGLLVNLTNPKAIVFMAALVPQFIDPHAVQWPQFAIMSVTTVVVDTIVMSAYAKLAARFAPLLRSSAALRTQNRVFGSLFVGAGAFLAASSR
ncbi:MAG: homoserine/homoserine lactone efflux protein [Rhodocyclaceae bacterium]|nr:homoserine/homoserine lactone efflux protein [Rhodocyclaceae bacterium]MCP5239961.1 homoserine/homoserine lactone efflux protein [Zoogloeaceae bacterium]